MTYEITYTTNSHYWDLEDIAAQHGYTKKEDCYWTQIYRDEAGNEIITVRDEKTAVTNPAAELAAMLTPQPEEPARIAEKLENARQALEARTDNSARKRGVNVYALELLESLTEYAAGGYITAEQLTTRSGIREALKNGAPSWPAYSSGGYSLIYDGDIAARLCTPSELKRTRDGERNPNSRETWLDVQARALSQAAARVVNAVMGG